MLRFLARLIAVICAIAFVFVTIGVIFFHAAGTRVFESGIYKRALAKERIYTRLPGLVADLVIHGSRLERGAAQGGGDDTLALVGRLTTQDWNTMFNAVAPPGYLEQQTDRALDQYFEFLHGDAAVPSVLVSLDEMRKRLVSPDAEQAYLSVLAGKPLCTPAEMEAAGGLPVVCRPPPDLMPRVRENFRTAMQRLAERMPGTVDIFAHGYPGPVGRAMNFLADERDLLQRIEWWARWSPAGSAALLLLIAVFAVRSLRGWMLWWGIPCFLAGAAALIVALPVVPISHWVFSSLVMRVLPSQVPAESIGALFGLMVALVREVMLVALRLAAYTAGAGLLLMIVASLCKRRRIPDGATPAA